VALPLGTRNAIAINNFTSPPAITPNSQSKKKTIKEMITEYKRESKEE
jgi:hypothetical protein